MTASKPSQTKTAKVSKTKKVAKPKEEDKVFGLRSPTLKRAVQMAGTGRVAKKAITATDDCVTDMIRHIANEVVPHTLARGKKTIDTSDMRAVLRINGVTVYGY